MPQRGQKHISTRCRLHRLANISCSLTVQEWKATQIIGKTLHNRVGRTCRDLYTVASTWCASLVFCALRAESTVHTSWLLMQSATAASARLPLCDECLGPCMQDICSVPEHQDVMQVEIDHLPQAQKLC